MAHCVIVSRAKRAIASMLAVNDCGALRYMLLRWTGHRLLGLVATWFAAWGVLAGAHADDGTMQRFEYTAVIMAVDAEITLFCTDEQTAKDTAKAAFDRMNALNETMSDYIVESELMRLCRAKHDTPVPVSADLFDVLKRSQQISKASGGAFDVTVGPLSQIWREARRTHSLPSQSLLTSARARVGWNFLELNATDQTVSLRREHMQLDLGAIGKGFAVDEAMKILRDRGLDQCLVRLAGDIAVGSPPPGEDGWVVAITQGLDADVRPTVTLCHQAISTSGDLEQHIDIDGTRYSHIIDPRTGLALTARRAVTVISPGATTSDALATAICVLGADAGKQLVEKFPGTSFLLHELIGQEFRETRIAGFPNVNTSRDGTAPPAAIGDPR